MIMIAKSCNETRFRLFWDALYIGMMIDLFGDFVVLGMFYGFQHI